MPCTLKKFSVLTLLLQSLKTWKVGQSGSLSFEFATSERNGLLFYNGAGGSTASGPMGGGGGVGGSVGGLGPRKDNGKVSPSPPFSRGAPRGLKTAAKLKSSSSNLRCAAFQFSMFATVPTLELSGSPLRRSPFRLPACF